MARSFESRLRAAMKKLENTDLSPTSQRHARYKVNRLLAAASLNRAVRAARQSSTRDRHGNFGLDGVLMDLTPEATAYKSDGTKGVF